MANKTVSNLNELTTVSNSDILLVETATETLKVTKGNLLKEVNEQLNAKSNASHTHDELHSHDNLATLHKITEAKIKAWDAKSDFSGSYNDLTNKPTIPTVDVTKAYVDSEVSKKADKTHSHSEYATPSYVQAKIAEASLSGGDVDLSAYATKDELNAKADKTHTHDEYVTEDDLNSKGLATETFVTNKVAEAQFSSSDKKLTSKHCNPLRDKNIVIFGDSLSDVSVNGKWVEPFKELINCKSFNNYARGFCTFTFKSDSKYNIIDTSDTNVGNNVIWNQFNRLKNDVNAGKVNEPDIIMILAGTNDVLQAKPLGDIDNTFKQSSQGTDVTALTTLCQSVRFVCDEVYSNYPTCKIVLCTPLPLNSIDRQSRCIEVRNTLIQCAEYLGLYTIDQTCKSGFVWYREPLGNRYYTDGIHLTSLGGEYVADFLYKELLSLPLLYENPLKEVALASTDVYTITNNLTNVTNNNSATSVSANSNYSATLTANDGYTLDTPIITMGDTDITREVYSNGTITIPFVTGNVVITCTATQNSQNPVTKATYFRDGLFGTCTQGVWNDSIMIPDCPIPASKLVKFRCNAFANGTAYLIAFRKEDTSFTPLYFERVNFTTGENTFTLNYVAEEEIYFGWKSETRGFVGMDLSSNAWQTTNQQFESYWGKSHPLYVPTIGTAVSSFSNAFNPGMAFDCLIEIEVPVKN